jgi:HEAT repeat protein
LIRSLREGRDSRERLLAAFLLGRLGPAAQEAIPALAETLEEPPGARPVTLAVPLPTTGRFAVAPPAAAAVEESPRDWDPAVEAAPALGSIAKGTTSSAAAVAALKQALRSEYPWRRGAAARGLMTMGKEATAAVPALATALTEAVTGRQEPNNGESWIARALGEVAPDSASAPQAIQALIAALETQQSAIRGWAAESLGQFGPKAASAIPRLRTLVDDSNRFVAGNAKAAIASIEGKAKPRQAAAKAPGNRPASAAD